jgi:hypothetical protein
MAGCATPTSLTNINDFNELIRQRGASAAYDVVGLSWNSSNPPRPPEQDRGDLPSGVAKSDRAITHDVKKRVFRLYHRVVGNGPSADLPWDRARSKRRNLK